jgi:UDP-glucuronate decarboxylase
MAMLSSTTGSKNNKLAKQSTSEIEDELASEFSPKFSGKNILVTGGAGFLGSWLSTVMGKAGGKVDAVDNLATGMEKNISARMNVRFIQASVEDGTVSGFYDYIFHFASRASPEEYQLYPVQTLLANSIGTMKMLDLAKKSSGCVMVYASSSEIYGDGNVFPTPETYYGNVNPIGIRSCYDEGKRFGEALCMAYFRNYSMDVRMVRIFNTYGEKIREDGAYARALPRFLVQALRGAPITIYGDGKQTRSFTYVSDTIRGILKLATTPNMQGEVFNIGNTQEITILQLAETILKKTGSKSKFTFSPLGQDDPKRRQPDITKAVQKLGWSPKVSLEEGLERTIDYFTEKYRS